MVRVLTRDQHRFALTWAQRLTPQSLAKRSLPCVSPAVLIESQRSSLIQYFRLCALSRNKNADPRMASDATDALFRTRVILESHIQQLIAASPGSLEKKLKHLGIDSFFGVSKKQGVSLRMPLNTCRPTSQCAGGCYAHDVLDAAPPAIVRGAINGFIARTFEDGPIADRALIIKMLRSAIRRAARAACRELDALPQGFTRRPYIRFSHVGEIAAFPLFANALALEVAQQSDAKVDCVVYTRHHNARLLDEKLWVINFTLDPASHDRRSWAPSGARLVYSAFGGEISAEAEVNFLEHHRHSHLAVTKGNGAICPATLPSCEVRTCDACRCSTCFERPNASEGPLELRILNNER
jgi:hypothetical protein